MNNITLAEYLEEKLGGCFWTKVDEMIQDIEECGCTVLEAYGEYVVVDNGDYAVDSDNEDADKETILYLGHAYNTMWVEKVRTMR